MTAHRIRLLGDPILRARCEPIKNPRSAAVRLVADGLQDTLHDLQARTGMGRGLAAPQIGAPIRLVYIDMGKPFFLVNPEIVDIGEHDFAVWDDCFSIPSLLVRVMRAYKITVRYEDLKGKAHELAAEKDLAELLQHEIDHLDGVLMLDRAIGLDPYAYREEWVQHHKPEERYGPVEPRWAPTPVPVG
ncbi:MAG TPA: peptide deformylase [Gemmatimonadales bacterium]|nr:peptide deformylase [Gemmatimonadales bacterium]